MICFSKSRNSEGIRFRLLLPVLYSFSHCFYALFWIQYIFAIGLGAIVFFSPLWYQLQDLEYVSLIYHSNIYVVSCKSVILLFFPFILLYFYILFFHSFFWVILKFLLFYFNFSFDFLHIPFKKFSFFMVKNLSLIYESLFRVNRVLLCTSQQLFILSNFYFTTETLQFLLPLSTSHFKLHTFYFLFTTSQCNSIQLRTTFVLFGTFLHLHM